MTAVAVDRLRVTMQQIERLIRALDDLRENVLPVNPELFATMVEGPLDDLHRMQLEVHEQLDELVPWRSA
jgi:hypothetical protein